MLKLKKIRQVIALLACMLFAAGCASKSEDNQSSPQTQPAASAAAASADVGAGADNGGYVDIDTGAANHTSFNCLLTNGTVTCAGENTNGQLGDGTTTTNQEYHEVTGLGHNIVAIVSGKAHSCALSASGVVKCWGANDHGQIGDGSTTDAIHPVVTLAANAGVESLIAGDNHTCAVLATQSTLCWGLKADGSGEFSLSPSQW